MSRDVTDIHREQADFEPELAKSFGIEFLSCIGIGIVKANFKVLVLVLVLLRGFSKYWYC